MQYPTNISINVGFNWKRKGSVYIIPDYKSEVKILSLTAILFLLTQWHPEGLSHSDELALLYSNDKLSYAFNANHTFDQPAEFMKIDDNLLLVVASITLKM